LSLSREGRIPEFSLGLTANFYLYPP
jgi:hypothetical protein